MLLLLMMFPLATLVSPTFPIKRLGAIEAENLISLAILSRANLPHAKCIKVVGPLRSFLRHSNVAPIPSQLLFNRINTHTTITRWREGAESCTSDRCPFLRINPVETYSTSHLSLRPLFPLSSRLQPPAPVSVTCRRPCP